jgi:hypothetical protein
MEHSAARDVVEKTPTWVRAVSIPTAALGIIAFFLPWFQVSCGPVHVAFSGYDVASGHASEKLDSQRTASAYKGLFRGETRRQAHPPRTTVSPDKETSRRSLGPNTTPTDSDPLLWVVPGACAVLLLMALFGLPRFPTIFVSWLGAAYLAYFWVTGDRAASDPANTGGILTFDWQIGFWTTWVGMVVPMMAALLKPRTHRLAPYVQPTVYLPSHPATRPVSLAAPPWTPPPPRLIAPQGPVCHVCRTASAGWRCGTHGLMLCAQCRPNYQCPPPSYGCKWQPVQVSRPQAVMTSPLGGLR